MSKWEDREEVMNKLITQLRSEIAEHDTIFGKKMVEIFLWKSAMLVLTFISTIFSNFTELFQITALALVSKIILNVTPCIVGLYTLRTPDMYANLNRRLRDEKKSIVDFITVEMLKPIGIREDPDVLFMNVTTMINIVNRSVY